eukprot:scaffold5572_cov390-Prasinococcus_capsulatus_cf.AAC.10
MSTAFSMREHVLRAASRAQVASHTSEYFPDHDQFTGQLSILKPLGLSSAKRISTLFPPASRLRLPASRIAVT